MKRFCAKTEANKRFSMEPTKVERKILQSYRHSLALRLRIAESIRLVEVQI